MMHYVLVYGALVWLLIILIACIAIGHVVGRKQLQAKSQEKLQIVASAEAAVFGLLALLIAFTFSSAYDRYEERKMHAIEEANLFDRAYNYIDLMPKPIQPTLRKDVRHYLELHIQMFNDVPNENKVNQDLVEAQALEEKLWHDIVNAVYTSDNLSLPQVYIPAYNEMFESAHTGYQITRIHPPIVIFVLLIALAALGAFLVGYNSAESKQMWPLHSISYALLTAITIYVIINMEFPRVGFIGMGHFDIILAQTLDNMIEPKL